MTLVTLLTDFGLKDGNVGVMKGVIWRFAPQVHIADISHLVAPQNIPEAAFLLGRSAPFFPDGSIHVVVVDPGVGTMRRPLAARLGAHYFVGPDNGVVTMLLEHCERFAEQSSFVYLDRPEFWLPVVSHVFHGRDIFAPVAGRLASGVPLANLGTVIEDPLRLALPQPEQTPEGWRGEVIYIDDFGNIATNITSQHLAGQAVKSVNLRQVSVDGMLRTFGERPPGTLVSLLGSTGNLLVCEVNGNAAGRLDMKTGDVVVVVLEN